MGRISPNHWTPRSGFRIATQPILMDQSPSPKTFRPTLLMLFFLLGLFFIFTNWFQYQANVAIIPYSQFLGDLNQGKLAEVTLGQTRISGRLKQAKTGEKSEFLTIRVDDPMLVQRLTEKNVKFSGMVENNFFGNILSWLLPLFIVFFIWSFVLRRSQGVGQGTGFLSLGKSKAKIYVETHLKTRFNDVAGIDEAKEEVSEIVNFLKDPARYSKLGGRMPKGILLVGPPGTGKTLLARAIAGEANVPFFSINGSEFVELFVGLGAARVRDLFEQARIKSPCIIFIDELDAIGKARGISAITGSGNDEKEQTLNQLLAEMDGFDPARGIILLAATNRPEVLDPALLRAGRFDRQILIDKPDKKGRQKILEIHVQSMPLAIDVNLDAIAGMTAGFSGADLANMANEAALFATRRGAEKVELKDFTAALERIVAGLERKSRLLNAEEKRRVAYHELGHAIVALSLDKTEIVHKVSIIPRGISALGYTMRRPAEDRYLISKRELETKIAVALGGRAAETVFFNDISTGAGDDLDKATDIARAMVTRYGMIEQLGLTVFEKEPSTLLGSQAPVRTFDYGERTANRIDDAIRTLLNTSFQEATELVRLNTPLIKEAAVLLLQKETLDESELKSLWNKYQVQLKAS